MKTQLALLLAGTLTASAQAQVLPKDAVVEGKTIGEWTAECWKWIYSIPTNENPQLDCEGRWANNRQPNPSVFLVAPLNGLTPPPCSRTFTVPEEMYILLPVLGITIDNIDTVPPFTIEQMHDALNSVLDAPAELHASIDGVPVPNLIEHRATSPPFSFDFPDGDNTLTLFYQHPIIGLDVPVIGDGYWLMLGALPLGPHVPHTGGQLSQSIFFPHDIICNITVVPVPLDERLEHLVSKLTQSDLPPQRKQPLLASLNAAKASFESTNLNAGIGQLNAFLNKVPAQVARSDNALANQLVQAAQRVIDNATISSTSRKPKTSPKEGEPDENKIRTVTVARGDAHRVSSSAGSAQ